MGRLQENWGSQGIRIQEGDMGVIQGLERGLRTVDPKNPKAIYLMNYPVFD